MPDPAMSLNDLPPLSPRILGRTDRAVSPIWWRLDDRAVDASVHAILRSAAQAGANWVLLPAQLPVDTIARWQPALHAIDAKVVLGIDAGDLNTRVMKPVYARLDALVDLRCEGLLLQSLTLSEVKAGRPFHRFSRLRDEGRVTLCLAEADDFASAEWMVEHTPAHAILATFGLEDPTLRHRVTDAARDLGTAIIARRASQPIWSPPEPITAESSISFALSHSSVAAVMEDLPATGRSLHACLSAAAEPMDDRSAAGWWDAIEPQVPPSPKPKGGHPPEFGA